METLHKFMENQLSLLWRYTLRKKALTRKVDLMQRFQIRSLSIQAYEMVLHHYASLVQELEPNEFSASLKCYPEATVVQQSLLNELEEQFVPQDEMMELYRDVEEVLAQFDDLEDGYEADHPLPPDPPRNLRPGQQTCARCVSLQLPLSNKKKAQRRRCLAQTEVGDC